jgi:hypothetical protein
MAASYGLVWTVATVEDFQRLMAYWAAHGRVSPVVAECNRLAEIYPHQLDGGASQAWDDYCDASSFSLTLNGLRRGIDASVYCPAPAPLAHSGPYGKGTEPGEGIGPKLLRGDGRNRYRKRI